MRALSEHIAVVTGAGSGIGRAIASRLAAEGAAVVVNDLSAESAEATVAAIRPNNAKVCAVQGDVSSAADVDRLFDRCHALFGDCTALVNNAGFVHQAPFERLAAEEWDRMIAVHLRGTFLCSRRAITAMLHQGEGAIVNIASQLGQIGGIELCHYSAAFPGNMKTLAR